MPRLRGRELEAAEQKVGQDGVREFKDAKKQVFVRDYPPTAAEKAAQKPVLVPKLIEPVDRPVDKDWADTMAFNEEYIEITVHTSADKNAEPVVEVFNNGIRQNFIRGQKQRVKRKFVEVLARAKMTTYSNQKITMEGGEEAYVYPESTSLRYPFAVHSDPNPRGIDWLKSILAEG